MEYRLSEYSPTERKVDDREGQCNVWYNGYCKGGFYISLQLAFRGNTEQHQLTLISQLCGCINTDSFPGCDKLELYNKLELPKGQKRKVKERLKAYVKCPFALICFDKLLTLIHQKELIVILL
ncbi:cyclin-dependent kinase 9 [Trichonephila clavipes]|nr:cyclin-dependent kinase 9 [Trichonephila clavipes]